MTAPRPSSAARGYDRAWHKVRRAFLAANPFCAFCGILACEVDHIIPVRRRPDLRLQWFNLRSLCSTCHSRRTAQEQLGWKSGHGALADGSPAEPGHPWGGKP